MSDSRKPVEDLIPLGVLGGAAEFEDMHPVETMRLGALTAYWALVEHSLCDLLKALLSDGPKAEAIFYSTVNHKARRDMVLAVSRSAKLPERTAELVENALGAVKDAAESRNELLHGMLHVKPISGELTSLGRRPATRKPIKLKKNILTEINSAIEKCEFAVGASQTAAATVLNPDWPDVLKELYEKGLAKRQASS